MSRTRRARASASSSRTRPATSGVPDVRMRMRHRNHPMSRRDPGSERHGQRRGSPIPALHRVAAGMTTERAEGAALDPRLRGGERLEDGRATHTAHSRAGGGRRCQARTPKRRGARRPPVIAGRSSLETHLRFVRPSGPRLTPSPAPLARPLPAGERRRGVVWLGGVRQSRTPDPSSSRPSDARAGIGEPPHAPRLPDPG